MKNVKKSLILLSLSLFCLPQAWAQDDEYAAVRDKLQTCVACHGEKGAAPIQSTYPILAGQHQYYLYVQLKDLKSGARKNAVMNPIAAGLEKAEMLNIAKYFSEQEWPRSNEQGGTDLVELGERAAAAGQCVQCHLGGYEGTSGVARLANQNYSYLRQTLLDYKNRVRTNAPDKSSLMEAYSDEELDGLAQLLSGQ